MNCAPHDLRDYFFDELDAGARDQVRSHLESCSECMQEVERLRATSLCLSALTEEEVPRRLAFVSDKIFEPSLVARWWHSLSAPGLRFAGVSALVLAGAIVFHAYRFESVSAMSAQRAGVSSSPNAAPIVAGQGQAALAGEAFTPEETQTAIDRAVAKALAASENRYRIELRKAAVENQTEMRRYMERTQETLDAMDRRNRVMTIASNRDFGAGQ